MAQLTAMGIGESDFLNGPLNDFGQTLTLTPRTKTISNVTGSPTFTSSTATTIQAFIFKRAKDYDWQKEGLFEGGDFVMYAKQDADISKDDLISYNGETLRIDKILLRTIGDADMFKTCNLYKI